MGTYVVGDIHGHYDEWIKFKEKIEAKDSEAKFILVGDIVDRGPKPLEMLDWCLENITKDGKYQMILGNHELEKIMWMEAYFNLVSKYSGILDVHVKDVKPDNYDFADHLIAKDIDNKTIKKYLKWMKNLDYYKDLTINNLRFIVVHANIAYSLLENDKISLKKKDDIDLELLDYITFNRELDGNYILDNTILIHGHTPTCLGRNVNVGADPGRIRFTYNRVNVDCGLCYRKYLDKQGDLGAIRLEDLEEIYLYGDTLDNKDTLYKKSIEYKKEMIDTYYK